MGRSAVLHGEEGVDQRDYHHQDSGDADEVSLEGYPHLLGIDLLLATATAALPDSDRPNHAGGLVGVTDVTERAGLGERGRREAEASVLDGLVPPVAVVGLTL